MNEADPYESIEDENEAGDEAGCIPMLLLLLAVLSLSACGTVHEMLNAHSSPASPTNAVGARPANAADVLCEKMKGDVMRDMAGVKGGAQ